MPNGYGNALLGECSRNLNGALMNEKTIKNIRRGWKVQTFQYNYVFRMWKTNDRYDNDLD